MADTRHECGKVEDLIVLLSVNAGLKSFDKSDPVVSGLPENKLCGAAW